MGAEGEVRDWSGSPYHHGSLFLLTWLFFFFSFFRLTWLTILLTTRALIMVQALRVSTARKDYPPLGVSFSGWLYLGFFCVQLMCSVARADGTAHGFCIRRQVYIEQKRHNDGLQLLPLRPKIIRGKVNTALFPAFLQRQWPAANATHLNWIFQQASGNKIGA